MFDSRPAIGAKGAQSWRGPVGRYHSIARRLAWRNITRDRVRLIMAVTGVAFAVLLMTVQLGLLAGFAATSSSLVDRSKADLWIVPRGAKDVDQAGQILERQKFTAVGVPGVESVESLIVGFSPWKRPDGGSENVIVVGVEPNGLALQPWNFIAGSAGDLGRADGVIIDDLYSGKLGISGVGETVEILGRRARVVGITSGVRTFTQSPYVFSSLSNARLFTGVPDGWTTYLLVRVRKGADIATIRNALQQALPSTDVWTSGGFSWQTREYWLLTTGAGAALLVAAILGLIVGLVIVAQTLYSAAVERMGEFATIRAMGANDRYLTGIVVHQSLIGGLLGYLIGTGAAFILVPISNRSSVALDLPFTLVAALAVVTLAMCAGASVVPVRKVLSVDVASVFR